MESTFKLQDTDGNAFRIKIIFPWYGTIDDGTWQALDQGYLSAIGGSIRGIRHYQNLAKWNLRLSPPNPRPQDYLLFRDIWGLYGWSSVGFADAGSGLMYNLGLKFKSGEFSWIKL